MVATEGWLAIGLSVALFLFAAKSHGRQVRLERELEGYMDASFGSDSNPAWVEALWKRDRVRFWIMFANAAAVFGIVHAGLAMSGSGSWDGLDARPLGSFWVYLGVGTLLWAPVVAFLRAGLSSLARFAKDLRGPARQETGRRVDEVRSTRGPWLSAAVRGSAIYWSFAIVLSGFVFFLAYF